MNLNRQDIVLEEVAKASMLMETRYQPEFNLTMRIMMLMRMRVG